MAQVAVQALAQPGQCVVDQLRAREPIAVDQILRRKAMGIEGEVDAQVVPGSELVVGRTLDWARAELFESLEPPLDV